MKNMPLLIGTIVGTLLLVIGIAVFFSNSQSNTVQQMTADPAVVAGDSRNVIGAVDGSITIVEFSDFQCPACGATAPLLKQVLAAYPEDVKLVYRHYPLGSFPFSHLAAEAAEVAGSYGKFWEYHDLIFNNQAELARVSSETDAKAMFIAFAAELGIDTTEFQEKIDARAYQEVVLADLTAGRSLGITGTPTLFVNGQRVSAPNQLPSLIDALLASQANEAATDADTPSADETAASQSEAADDDERSAQE